MPAQPQSSATTTDTRNRSHVQVVPSNIHIDDNLAGRFWIWSNAECRFIQVGESDCARPQSLSVYGPLCCRTSDCLLCGELCVVHCGVRRKIVERFEEWQRHLRGGRDLGAHRNHNRTTSQKRPKIFSALHRNTPRTRKGTVWGR